MNNKGFTLVELLAVLAVMITILLIAIPSITSSVERNKGSLDKQKIKTIFTASEVYSDLYLNQERKIGFTNGYCGIEVEKLISKDLIDEKTTIMETNIIDGKSVVTDLCVWYDTSLKKYIFDNCGQYYYERCDTYERPL